MTVNADRRPRDVVVVAASAGGLPPLRELFAALSPDLPMGMAVVFHRNPFADGMLLPVLQRGSGLPVVEPPAGERFAHGLVFLAPRDRHLFFQGDTFHLSRGPALHFLRPAADVLFSSAAEALGPRVLGVVLSGAGFDGAQGAIDIKKAGGIVLAQENASMPFMPRHAVQRDHVDAVLPLTGLSAAIAALARGEAYEP